MVITSGIKAKEIQVGSLSLDTYKPVDRKPVSKNKAFGDNIKMGLIRHSNWIHLAGGRLQCRTFNSNKTFG
jgi:hypothetical protein